MCPRAGDIIIPNPRSLLASHQHENLFCVETAWWAGEFQMAFGPSCRPLYICCNRSTELQTVWPQTYRKSYNFFNAILSEFSRVLRQDTGLLFLHKYYALLRRDLFLNPLCLFYSNVNSNRYKCLQTRLSSHIPANALPASWRETQWHRPLFTGRPVYLFANKTFACDPMPMICLQYVVIPTMFVNTRLNKSEGEQMSKVQWQIESLGVSKAFTSIYQQSHI